jgi:hypothetical protein
MEPILDETSLVPCPVRPAPARVLELARTLKALDALGAKRILRSVRDAADRDLGGGQGLRAWCYNRSTDKDARLLVAGRLGRQPYIDGPAGLFAAAEGTAAVEAMIAGAPALGAGLAALTDGVLVGLASEAYPAGRLLTVELTHLDEDDVRSEQIELPSLCTTADVEQHRASIVERIDRDVPDGKALVERMGEMFPRLLLGDAARDQIEALSGNEPVFRQLLRHLRALDGCARQWEVGTPFEPNVTFSVESQATLHDGTLGPMRDFPTPSGFEHERWKLHTKLTGGAEARLYFRPARAEAGAVVLIGYFGDHLPTVKFRK